MLEECIFQLYLNAFAVFLVPRWRALITYNCTQKQLYIFGANFFLKLDMEYQVSTLSSLLLKWWSKVEVTTVHEWLKTVLPAAVMWFVWKARNKAFFLKAFQCLVRIFFYISKGTCKIYLMLSKLNCLVGSLQLNACHISIFFYIILFTYEICNTESQ